MIGFSDQGLALLAIAAGRVRHNQRAKWLRRLARQLEPTPNAVRLRNARHRQDNGVSFFRLELPTVEVEQLLLREGLLVGNRDFHRAEVELALAEFITRLCAFDMHVEPESGNDL
jgi:hypothetical protein